MEALLTTVFNHLTLSSALLSLPFFFPRRKMLNVGFHFTLYAEYFYIEAVQHLLTHNVWTFPQPHVVQTVIKLTETVRHWGQFSEGKNT